jgi:diphosphomevalonate decarboxylase
MKKQDIVAAILSEKLFTPPAKKRGEAFAPTNIALCKYWGKRNTELNLPMTSSLSISLGERGAFTTIELCESSQDHLALNGENMAMDSAFGQRVKTFLDLFRHSRLFFKIDIQLNIPFAAGLASSACGFASLVLALNNFFDWQLTEPELSILARLGSGSACRSINQGFVEWRAGSQANGMDSYGEKLAMRWVELRVGLLMVSSQTKPISSSEAMKRTVATSALYSAWPAKVVNDMALIKQAVVERNFIQLGETAESNALNMHAMMLSAWPPILYALPETILGMQKIWKLREEGVAVYFTQDAGPNLKLLFLDKELSVISQHFPGVEIVKPFG